MIYRVLLRDNAVVLRLRSSVSVPGTKWVRQKVLRKNFVYPYYPPRTRQQQTVDTRQHDVVVETRASTHSAKAARTLLAVEESQGAVSWQQADAARRLGDMPCW